MDMKLGLGLWLGLGLSQVMDMKLHGHEYTLSSVHLICTILRKIYPLPSGSLVAQRSKALHPSARGVTIDTLA
jgi:hypothetical protein